jgi:hypothetical protein
MVARRPVVGSGRYGRAPDVVVATPTAQSVSDLTGGPRDQCCEQALDLVAGHRDQPRRSGVAGTFGQGCHDQEGMGEHRQRDPPVARAPATDLTLVQADQALASLEAFLDGPAASGDIDQDG